MPAALTPAQIVRRQVALGAVALAPDGAVAFTRRIVADLRSYRTHLWLVPWRGGAPLQLTRGAVEDASPAFDAEGGRLAFLRDDQVWVLPRAGGEPEKLTALPHGVSSFAWSPDGRSLLLAADAPEPRFAVGRLQAAQPPLARRITRLDWRLDGTGMLDRRTHLWVMRARAGARPRQITSGDWAPYDACWSPDSRTICLSADRGPDADIEDSARLWLVDARGGEPRELCSLPGLCRTPAFAPDGARVVFRGVEVAGCPENAPEGLYAVAVAGGNPVRLAFDERIYPIAEHSSDLVDWRTEVGAGIGWDEDGRPVCPGVLRGHVRLWRYPDAGSPEPITPQGATVQAYDAHSGRIVVSASLDAEPPEVYAVEGGELRRLTRSSSRWARPLSGLRNEQVDVPGPAGPVRTWILHPRSGDGPAPTVLSIHGGPTGSWTPVPWLPDIALADAGIRVLRPDPRGSASYGPDWLGALMGNWGRPDSDDVLAVVDWAVAEGLADPDRLGVFGLSYGGFLAHWLIGHDDRFRAAVAVNGVTDQITAAGICDLAWPYTPRLGFGALPGYAMDFWRQSPLATVDRITTPLLMLQGGADLRCPPADNEQLFTALRVLRREVEYVLYPDESHVMQAIARPDRRIDMVERTLAWFAGHGVGQVA